MCPFLFYMAEDKSIVKDFFRRLRLPLLFRGNTTAKLLFILLSVFLWFLIKLSKEGYTTEFSFPVEYVNIPSDKRFNQKPVSAIKVRVRSHGYDLLKHKLRSFRPIEVELGSNVKFDGGRYYWVTNSKKGLINLEFDDNTEIVSINPDTVFFDFNAVKSKKVKVYLNSKRLYSNFKTFFSPPEISPDSIIISGAEQDVNRIDSIFTEAVELKAAEDTVIHKVDLQLPKNKGLEFSAKSVSVKVRYTNLTEGTFNIPVKVINLPVGYELNVFPAKVLVKYQVPVQDFDRVSDADFEAYVDFAEIQDNPEARFLAVKLQAAPAFLRKVTVDPKQLEFILIKK